MTTRSKRFNEDDVVAALAAQWKVTYSAGSSLACVLPVSAGGPVMVRVPRHRLAVALRIAEDHNIVLAMRKISAELGQAAGRAETELASGGAKFGDGDVRELLGDLKKLVKREEVES